jgi:hypothetical protein
MFRCSSDPLLGSPRHRRADRPSLPNHPRNMLTYRLTVETAKRSFFEDYATREEAQDSLDGLGGPAPGKRLTA